MIEFLNTSSFFGLALSLAAYMAGMALKKRFRSPLFNPLLIAIVLTMGVLLLTGVKYDDYLTSAGMLSKFLTPATVCLAIPLYERLDMLKKNYRALLCGILSGVVTSVTCILALCALFGIGHAEYVTLLPKSVTTAIGMGVAEQLGGYTSITAASIIITGILGNAIGEAVLKLFHITDPIAKGVALGSSAHAIGTVKAMELGETEGAMSSLSIAVAGVMTVVFATIYANFL